MANLGYSDATWTRLMREISLFVRIGRKIEDDRRKFLRERVQVVNEGTSTLQSNITASALTGIKYGTNTSEAGKIWLRFTANGGNWDGALYAAAGGASQVGAFTNVADGAVATITASNSSGLGGTLTLGAAVVSTAASDEHWIRVFADYKLELLKLWPSDGTTAEDTNSRSDAADMLASIASQYDSMQATVLAGLRAFCLSSARNAIARGGKFLKSASTTMLSETQVDDDSGNVSRQRTGFWQVLTEAMRDEATGSEQDIIKRLVAAAAATFDTNNGGLALVAAHTPEGHCPIGNWDFTCIHGTGNDRGGTEEFDCVFTSSVEGDDTTFTARGLRIKQSWKGPLGFGPVTLQRQHTKTGDSSGDNTAGTQLGAAGAYGTSTFTTTGENEDNTDNGMLYWRTTQDTPSAGLTKFEFFRAVGLATGDLVAMVTGVADGAANVTAAAQNGSGLTIVFTAGSNPVTDTGTLDLNFFTIDSGVEGTAKTPDKFRIVTSLTSEGKASRVLAELWQAYMNSDTSGSEQISDDLMAVANTFVPYLDQNI